jgi:hypothetical protein
MFYLSNLVRPRALTIGSPEEDASASMNRRDDVLPLVHEPPAAEVDVSHTHNTITWLQAKLSNPSRIPIDERLRYACASNALRVSGHVETQGRSEIHLLLRGAANRLLKDCRAYDIENSRRGNLEGVAPPKEDSYLLSNGTLFFGRSLPRHQHLLSQANAQMSGRVFCVRSILLLGSCQSRMQ